MFICVNIYIYMNVYIYRNQEYKSHIYIYIYLLTPPVDRPCPCDSALLAGDLAEILYLNTPHTTIFCKVKALQ